MEVVEELKKNHRSLVSLGSPGNNRTVLATLDLGAGRGLVNATGNWLVNQTGHHGHLTVDTPFEGWHQNQVGLFHFFPIRLRIALRYGREVVIIFRSTTSHIGRNLTISF